MSRLDPAARLTQPAHLPATPPQATTPPVDNTRPPSPPRMHSVPTESDGMDIDSGDKQEPASSRGVKRARQRTNDDARDDAPLPSTPPDLKRQRTETPPPPQVIETFSQQQHGALIALIQKHGGDVVASDGDTVRLALPPDTQLNFCVEYFCARHAMLVRGLPFPGADTFAQTIFETTVHLLSVAALANQASLVRMLLATGLANQSGAQLRDLAQHAHAAGAMAAVDAITDTCAYWVQGLDPATLGHPTESSIQVGHSDQPPPDWQARSRKEFNNEQAQALLTAFYNADTDAILDLLFPPEHRPESGSFFLRVVPDSAGHLSELARSSGAITVDNDADENILIVYSTDFNREALMHALQQAASNEQHDDSSTSTLEMAAAWGDIALFKAVWSVATDDIRALCADLALYRAAEAGATDIVLHLLPHMDESTIADSALSLAAKHGRTATCAALLDAGVKLPKSMALNDAAGEGHIDICALLISQGHSIDGPAREDSPLLNATGRNREKTVRLLVAAGASLGRLNGVGASVLSLAAEHGNIGLYRYLVDCGAGLQVPPRHSPPMVHAAKNNHVAMLAYLLKSGEDIERRDYEGDSPLDIACSHGATDAVAFLIEQGACLTSPTSSFTNPLYRAIRVGSLPVLELLLRQGQPADDRLEALLRAIGEISPTW